MVRKTTRKRQRNKRLVKQKGGDDDYSVIVMNQVTGTLKDIETLSIDQVYTIVNTIIDNIICLKDKGLYYTDLKTANILYHCDEGKFSIFLGDLGSISQIGEPSIVTHLNPEFFETFDNKELIIVWCIGIIIVELLLKTTDLSVDFKKLLGDFLKIYNLILLM